MGGNNFFSKIASIDPIAQALNLPGAHSYANAQANAHLPSSSGPYSGVAASLAGANAGYAPGGPGANVWTQPTPWHQGGLFGALQGAASDVGGTSFGAQPKFNTQSPSATGSVGNVGPDPYAAAARRSAGQNNGGLYGQ